MKTANAIKKLENAGYTVEQKTERSYQVSTEKSVLEFRQNGGDADANIMCIGIRSANDQSDAMTDYCAFTFFDNLTQAMRCLATA